MKNIYEQTDANKRRSTLVIALFIVFVFGVTYLLVYLFDLSVGYLFYAGLVAGGYAMFGYFSGHKLVLALNGAKPATREEYFDLYTSVENLSIAAQIPRPAIYVINSASPNAFATGRDPQHAVIAVTTGLLAKLNRSELEAVVAHELGHVTNYDVRLMMLVSVLIGALSILTDTFMRVGLLGRERDDNRSSSSGLLAMVGFALLIFSPIIAQLMQLAVSRSREYLADTSSAKLTRQPAALISALSKIASDPTPLAQAAPSTASLYIANPFKGKKFFTLFSTHPPVEDRIKALRQML